MLGAADGMRRRPEADDQRGAGHGEMGPSGVGQGEVRPCQEDGTPRWDWCPCGERKRPGPTQSMVSRAEENPPPQVEATEPRRWPDPPCSMRRPESHRGSDVQTPRTDVGKEQPRTAAQIQEGNARKEGWRAGPQDFERGVWRGRGGRGTREEGPAAPPAPGGGGTTAVSKLAGGSLPDGGDGLGIVSKQRTPGEIKRHHLQDAAS